MQKAFTQPYSFSSTAIVCVLRRLDNAYRLNMPCPIFLHVQNPTPWMLRVSDTTCLNKDKESDNRCELKEDKVCWNLSKSVKKRIKMKWKSSKSIVKWNEVKWSEGGKNETLWEKFIWVVKWWAVKGWGESVSTICVGKNTRNYIQYFLTLEFFTFCTCWILRCLVCIVVSCLVCIVVVVLCVLLSSYEYLLYYVFIAVFTLDAGLLDRSQYSEGPATGHLDTGFSWFPCVYKQMLRWFPRFQVATTWFSCSGNLESWNPLT